MTPTLMWFSDLNQANEEIAQMAVTIDRLRTEIKRLDNEIARMRDAMSVSENRAWRRAKA